MGRSLAAQIRVPLRLPGIGLPNGCSNSRKRITWADLYRRFLTGRPGNRRRKNGIIMFETTTVPITRYRWRASKIPFAVDRRGCFGPCLTVELRGTPDTMRVSRSVRRAGRGKRAGSDPGTAPRYDPSIMGRHNRSAIATLVERSSRFVILCHLGDERTAEPSATHSSPPSLTCPHRCEER